MRNIEFPRVRAFKSIMYNYVELIDDAKHHIVLGLCDKSITAKTKVERAEELGKQFSKLLKEKGISRVRFDRAGFAYHGRIKAIAEAIRSEGITI